MLVFYQSRETTNLLRFKVADDDPPVLGLGSREEWRNRLEARIFIGVFSLESDLNPDGCACVQVVCIQNFGHDIDT